MKRTMILGAAICALMASAIFAFADIPRPKTSPAQGKTILYTGLTITTDPKGGEARLQISESTLKLMQQAAANSGDDGSMAQRVMHSSTRTIMAGTFMFLAVSFAGIWFARSGQRRNHKAVAAVLLVAFVFGISDRDRARQRGTAGIHPLAKLAAVSEGREGNHRRRADRSCAGR